MKRKNLLLTLLSVMCLSCFSLGAVGVWAEEGAYTYYNQDGTELTWAYDSNGVSTQVAYKADGSKYGMNGMYSPANCYRENADGSVFVLTAGSYIVLAPQDVTKEIQVSFTMDPNNAWSGQDANLGRFLFAAYDNMDDAFAAGNNAWQNANDEKFTAWGALKVDNENMHKLNIGGQKSKEVNYNGGNAVFTIKVGETSTDFYFGGEKFATTELKRSDFASGKMYISLISYDANLEAKVKISEKQGATTETAYYNQDGTPLTWKYDANGVSTQVAYNAAGVKYGMNGMYSPENCYREKADGSIFLLTAGSYLVLKPQDVTKEIEVSFTMDPSNSWSGQDTSLGRFLFAAYDNMDDAFAAGNNAWQNKNDEKFTAWGALKEDENKHKLNIGGQKSKEVNYNGNNAVFTIKVGETETDFYFGGEKFATTELKRSDFASGQMYLSLISYDTNLEAKVKIGSIEEPSIEYPDEPLTYYNEDGSELVWAFDKNGVSPQIPYNANGEKVNSYYGMYAPENCYGDRDDGSVFLLTAGTYMLLGEELDITKAINITFTMDPQEAWGKGGNLGRFVFSLFDNIDLAIRAGNSGWNPAYGAKVVAFGSQVETLNNEPVPYFHKMSVNGQLSDEFNYDGAQATLTIYIGEKQEDSFVAFNGKEFATLPVSQSDFRDGIGRLSVITLESTNEFKVNVSQSDIRTKVNILSSVAGFETMEVGATIGRAFKTPEMPVLEGYTFDALYVDEACIVKYNGKDPVSESTTFYAKYLDNSKTYHNVTLQSEIGGFDPITFTVEDGAVIGTIGDVFFSEGFDLKWKTEAGLFNELETAITEDLVLTAIWVEETVVLYHMMNGVVDENYLWEYLQDGNGWDSEYTAFDVGDTFVDANGKEIISSYYGSYQHETSFREYDTYSTFLLPGAGAITNLKKLDLTKEIVITYTANNWDTANNNYVTSGDITFQLFDNVLSALKAGHLSNENAKVAIMTSSLDLSVDFGRFKDVLNGVRQKHDSFKFEQDKQFIIKMFISEDGSENYVTVNGVKLEGAIAGLKRSDFKGGYAYLHIANNGSTHYFNCLLAQTSTLTLKETVNGTYSVDKTGEILFKDTVTITLNPDKGYAVKKVIINEEEYLPDSNNMITFYKGWDHEEIEVIFDKAFTATFVVGEGASVLAPQVVCTGDKFYKPSNPKKEGYKFVGWYADEALTIEYDFKALATADITLYAKWEEKPKASEKKGCKGEVGLSATIWASITLVSAGLAVSKKKKD